MTCGAVCGTILWCSGTSRDKLGMANSANGDVHILCCKHSDVTHLRGDITFHICSTINKINSNQAIGAQKLRGIWAIVVLSSETRLALLLGWLYHYKSA